MERINLVCVPTKAILTIFFLFTRVTRRRECQGVSRNYRHFFQYFSFGVSSRQNTGRTCKLPGRLWAQVSLIQNTQKYFKISLSSLLRFFWFPLSFSLPPRRDEKRKGTSPVFTKRNAIPSQTRWLDFFPRLPRPKNQFVFVSSIQQFQIYFILASIWNCATFIQCARTHWIRAPL